jgi:threonine/homoserine/homoserine lactone efflux protein
LSLVFMAVTFVVFAFYGLAAATMREGLVARPDRMRVVNRLLVGGFLLMAGKLALAQR